MGNTFSIYPFALLTRNLILLPSFLASASPEYIQMLVEVHNRQSENQRDVQRRKDGSEPIEQAKFWDIERAKRYVEAGVEWDWFGTLEMGEFGVGTLMGGRGADGAGNGGGRDDPGWRLLERLRAAVESNKRSEHGKNEAEGGFVELDSGVWMVRGDALEVLGKALKMDGKDEAIAPEVKMKHGKTVEVEERRKEDSAGNIFGKPEVAWIGYAGLRDANRGKNMQRGSKEEIEHCIEELRNMVEVQFDFLESAWRKGVVDSAVSACIEWAKFKRVGELKSDDGEKIVKRFVAGIKVGEGMDEGVVRRLGFVLGGEGDGRGVEWAGEGSREWVFLVDGAKKEATQARGSEDLMMWLKTYVAERIRFMY